MFEIIYYIRIILIMLLLVSLFGYVFVVIKEKLYLSKNIILIDKKSVTQDHIDKTDLKEFLLGGIRMKTGDEVKVTLFGDKNFYGIVIGAIKKDNSLIIVTHSDRIEKLKVNRIKKVKLVSKYGRFF